MPFKDKNKQRVYNRGYQKRYYSVHKDYYIRKAKERKRLFFAYIREIKVKLTCKKCGEFHPATLSFHHRDGSTKEYGINTIINLG